MGITFPKCLTVDRIPREGGMGEVLLFVGYVGMCRRIGYNGF